MVEKKEFNAGHHLALFFFTLLVQVLGVVIISTSLFYSFDLKIAPLGWMDRSNTQNINYTTEIWIAPKIILIINKNYEYKCKSIN